MQIVNSNDLVDLIDCMYERTLSKQKKEAYDAVIDLIYDIETNVDDFIEDNNITTYKEPVITKFRSLYLWILKINTSQEPCQKSKKLIGNSGRKQ